MRLTYLSLLSVVAANPIFNILPLQDEAPIISASNAKAIPNSYIVKFKDHVKHADAAAHHSWLNDLHTSHENKKLELRKRSQIPFLDDAFAGLKHTYNIAGNFLGYSGNFDDAVIEQLRRHPDIEYIEQDSEVHAMSPWGFGQEKDNEVKVSEAVTQKMAPWGLARISHHDGLSFGTFNKYIYSDTAGEGVDVYVIDTGVHVDHVDFEGRAKWGKTIPTGDADEDGNGHGTHCAGTIAGSTYGVSKKANVIAVKVLRSNGSGSMSDVVKGVEYAVESHTETMAAAKAGKKPGFKGSAANMSLGGGKSPTLDMAVNAAVDAGIHFAVAAGNDNADACNYSPAAAPNPITVGASTLADERAYFSNYGKCVDIFAPGLNILSTWIGSKTAVNTISGTSMASPHIAGLLAYMLSLQPSKDSAYAVAEITPKKMKDSLVTIATKGALSDIPSGTPNILAWNGGGSGNFSDIINKGGKTFEVAAAAAPIEEEEEIFKALPIPHVEFELPPLPEIEEIHIVIEKVGYEASREADKVSKLVEGIEEIVREEVRELVREMREFA